METFTRPPINEGEQSYDLHPSVLDPNAIHEFLGRTWELSEEHAFYILSHTHKRTGKTVRLYFPRSQNGVFRIADWKGTRIDLPNPDRVILRSIDSMGANRPITNINKRLVIEGKKGTVAIDPKTMNVTAQGELIINAKYGPHSETAQE